MPQTPITYESVIEAMRQITAKAPKDPSRRGISHLAIAAELGWPTHRDDCEWHESRFASSVYHVLCELHDAGKVTRWVSHKAPITGKNVSGWTLKEES